MKKRIFALVIIITIFLVTLSSCSLISNKDDPLYAEELHNVVEFITVEPKVYYLQYKDAQYYEDKLGFITVDETFYDDPSEEYIYLGWSGTRTAYNNFYYSDNVDSPIFIYESRTCSVYFREDYDYSADVFVIEGTDAEIMFSNIFFDLSDKQSYGPFHTIGYEIVLYSKKYPHLKVPLKLAFFDGKWYVMNLDLGHWEISNDFVELLIENGLFNSNTNENK